MVLKAQLNTNIINKFVKDNLSNWRSLILLFGSERSLVFNMLLGDNFDSNIGNQRIGDRDKRSEPII